MRSFISFYGAFILLLYQSNARYARRTRLFFLIQSGIAAGFTGKTKPLTAERYELRESLKEHRVSIKISYVIYFLLDSETSNEDSRIGHSLTRQSRRASPRRAVKTIAIDLEGNVYFYHASATRKSPARRNLSDT